VERHFTDHFDESNRRLLSIIREDLHWPGIVAAKAGDLKEGAALRAPSAYAAESRT
jgi:hypothetical protein